MNEPETVCVSPLNTGIHQTILEQLTGSGTHGASCRSGVNSMSSRAQSVNDASTRVHKADKDTNEKSCKNERDGDKCLLVLLLDRRIRSQASTHARL